MTHETTSEGQGAGLPGSQFQEVKTATQLSIIPDSYVDLLSILAGEKKTALVVCFLILLQNA